jgi:DNA-binding NarL/FixJ family response regulator
MERWREAGQRGASEIVDISNMDGLEARLTQHPDAIVLLDFNFPELHNGDGVESLLAQHHDARIIILTHQASDAECLRLLRLGVRGYLSARAAAPRVRQALDHVTAGEIWGPRRLLSTLLDECRQHAERASPAVAAIDNDLTVRQHEVIALVAEGLHNKEIARALDIAERTVKAHLSAIFKRTGTTNRTELALRFAPFERALSSRQRPPSDG